MAKSDLRLTGGEYALVADRITLFYERFPDGRIITELVSRSAAEVTFRALVFRSAAEREPAATGWASEREGDGDVNAVACLENTETSAVGRALANLGFTAAAQRPSAEEMAKAARARARLAAAAGLDLHAAPRPPRPPLRVAERAPGADAGVGAAVPPPARNAAAAAADAALRADVRLLLERAERAGLRPARSAAVRAALEAAHPPVGRLEEVERWLRRWLERRESVAPLVAPGGASGAATGRVAPPLADVPVGGAPVRSGVAPTGPVTG